MCRECLKTPCHPMCPNNEQPAIFGLCENCGEVVYEDKMNLCTDDYHNLFCDEDCAIEYHGIRKAD